ncbi:pentatricopeptide repeat-containing protein At4g21300 isoform X2 [Ziziphus jujuba]|uniref:Pentatricopeptide repeat-containing protein At4g21300 isoform X2 n=1 Tax=Ziziphus jujuba TaxID=326968 RepID=A0ABM3ZWC7_ZIZJJ|nr:pentatricopeptide repeat-containing protein At4g21300 isoform X2 [Ziziphus jujuba]
MKKFLCPTYRQFACVSKPMSMLTNTNGKDSLISPSMYTEETLENQFASILQACCVHALIGQGKQVHAQVVVCGLSKNCNLGTKILSMYVFCGSIMEARNVFYQLELRYALPWNWIIRGITMMGWFNIALTFYFKMLASGISPDKYTFIYVIKACSGLKNARLGKLVHETIQLMGLKVDVFVASCLIKLYADNGCIHDARCLFDQIPHKDIVLWNVMINGYVKNGDTNNSVEMFLKMKKSDSKPNAVTFACMLSICASDVLIGFATQLHGLAVSCGLELDSSVANTLLSMYSKCKCLSDARRLFDLMPQTDVVTWNGMISGYVQNGFMTEASHIFHDMVSAGVKPDSITFSSFLPSLAEYCRNVEMACKIFNRSATVDVVVCTAMISGFVLNGMNIDALKIFRWLLQEKMKPNSLTLASVLPAFAGLAVLRLGKELHGNIIKNGLHRKRHVGSAITDMYAKCGNLDLAHRVFQGLSERDAVCWNTMITSCSQNGKPEEAIDLFRKMGEAGAKYDSVSISSMLSACANLPAFHYGKEIHGFMIRRDIISDLFCASALIDWYAKCGNLDFSQHVFDLMPNKSEVSWNSIIAAYGNHGHLKDSLTLFHEMLENGILPDHVTFLGVISACGHAGQINEGIYYFHCMTEQYGIPARMEHYACMVDLFGRAGRLNEAFETIQSMPFSPDAGVWGTLLGACRVHGNVELAEVASKNLFDLDPQNSGYYILLSNINADAGKWGRVLEIRRLMKERGVQKVPGYSWIEVNNITHMFVAADGSHPQSAQIYLLLYSLLLELRKEGYVPQPYLPTNQQIWGCDTVK